MQTAALTDSLNAAEVIEGIVTPVLIITEGVVSHANTAARKLLGGYILGEDIRLAIRSPAAVEAWERDSEKQGPIDLFGLGGLDQHWEMHVCRASGGQRVVHLIDRTGEDSAERMRVDFVANASHELRTPLASVLGYIETLKDGEAGGDEATRNRFLTIIQDESLRMQRLVEDLISLSRIEAGKYRAPDAEVDLAELIEEVQSELPRHDIRLTLAGGVSPIQGDPAQLSQMLHNLVGNAVKYGRSGAPVRIDLRTGDDGSARITVSDEGEGIAALHLPRLTERFYRVDAGRSRSAGGTGLGLAIVKHIVERHGGRLRIESVVGRGTTITVVFPAATAVIKR
jgi:two-component system phosphate regulon sensor histidine kinase PhoR